MTEFVSLSEVTNKLVEDLSDKRERRNQSKSIQSRYRNAANKKGRNWHCSIWDEEKNNKYLMVKEEEFYEWIKSKHPELICKLPKEHQKIWKECIGYLDSSYMKGKYSPPPDATKEMLLIEIDRLGRLLADEKSITAELKPLAEKYKENCAKNTENAKRKR